MQITFWGTRGSLPSPLNGRAVRSKIVNALVKAVGRNLDTKEKAEAFCAEELSFSESSTYGGNSSCVQIDAGGPEFLLCDLGSGAREFSIAAQAEEGPRSPRTYHILLSHVHWDHIMGFPFFVPAFAPGNRIRFYSCHPRFEQAIRNQNHEPCFPVEFDNLKADIDFIQLEPGQVYEICGAAVTGRLQQHGNDLYAYRIEQGGKTVVYATDSEYNPRDRKTLEGIAEFFSNADLVIFDTMASYSDCISVKEDWGHASNRTAVAICQAAGAKQLCLFHHEPVKTDERIDRLLRETIQYDETSSTGDRLNICAAYDGLVIKI